MFGAIWLFASKPEGSVVAFRPTLAPLIHRPPRVPADRSPHCAWTVTIAADHPALPVPDEAEAMAATRAATIELPPIDPDDVGRHDYAGPLVPDLVFGDWSASALRRITDEICLQGHLLALSFLAAVAARTPTPEDALDFGRHQFTGVAGVAAERFRDALDLPATLAGAATLLGLHPGLLPYGYVRCDVDLDERLVVRIGRDTGAAADGAWPSLLDADHLGPLDAIVRAIDDHLHCEPVTDDDDGLVVEVVRGAAPVPESGDVALTRFSTGATHVFEDRATPVALRTTTDRPG